MKGSEERDLMFGRLFGLCGLIRSKILCNKNNLHHEEDLALEIFRKLLELFEKKRWLEELCVEALFDLLASVSQKTKRSLLPLFTQLAALDDSDSYGNGDGDNGSLSESQWMVRLYLQYLSQSDSMYSIVSRTKPFHFSEETLLQLRPLLLHATYKFPKLHRIWDYLLAVGLSLSLNSDRELLPIL